MKTPLFFIAFVLLQMVASAQYTTNAANGKITIDGTSTIHDWTENVEKFTGSLTGKVKDGKLESISSAKIVVEVNSIKSGKSGMDDNTYKALKQKEHPQITYQLKSYNITGSTVSLTGSLSIAGVTKTVSFKATYKMEGTKMVFTGSHTFKMTDFNIDPPTAVMGTIKTGDDITVKFNLTFQPK